MAEDTRLRLKPEERIVLLGARTPLDAATSARLCSMLSPALDWDYLLQTAELHRVGPLLLQALQSAAHPDVPAAAIARLETHLRRSAWRGEVLADALSRLTQALAEREVLAVPFKGPALAESLYGGVALRPCGDLDVLVPVPQLEEALDVCRQQGYRAVGKVAGEQAPDESKLARLVSRHYNLSLSEQRTGVHLELHWRFSPPHVLPVESELLWRHAAPAPFRGGVIQALPPRELLIVLCAHGTKHAWVQLSWIVDIAQLVRRHADLDWDEVLEYAGSLSCRRACMVGLVLAHSLLQAPVPSSIVKAARKDWSVLHLVRQVQNVLFRIDKRVLTSLEEALFHTYAMERQGQRLRFLLSHARHAATACLRR